MIDADTRARLDAVMKRALHDGVNLWDALDAARLIRHEETIRYDWANCLERLWLNLHSQPTVALVQLSPGQQNTPLDVHRGVLEYIDVFAKQFGTNPGEPR